jgi:hypothetical protein
MSKKTWLQIPVVIAVLFLAACSSSKSNQPTAERKEVKGTWLLDKISYDGLTPGAKYNITLLDEGYASCLEGSTWVFPNNGFGSYTISPSAVGCLPSERKIVWSYRLENGETIFQFKKLEEGVKAKKIEDGYKFKIVSATDQAMQLQTEAASEGKLIYVNYQFSKIK